MTVIPLRSQFRASLAAAPDTIDLFAALQESGNDLRSAGQSVYFSRRLGEPPTTQVLATAECAARRALRVIAEFRAASPVEPADVERGE